jgi:hypothetical protein
MGDGCGEPLGLRAAPLLLLSTAGTYDMISCSKRLHNKTNRSSRGCNWMQSGLIDGRPWTFVIKRKCNKPLRCCLTLVSDVPEWGVRASKRSGNSQSTFCRPRCVRFYNLKTIDQRSETPPLGVFSPRSAQVLIPNSKSKRVPGCKTKRQRRTVDGRKKIMTYGNNTRITAN